ncbi:MAG: DUF3644 domain-containing protein [Kiritimatiellae bacterium]|nr:DUF3644 domain-containing protein [Kiritimatiellia bacterium]
MKARHQQLLDRSIAAMLAGIEIYNKPLFPYRVESFTMLAINAWELLFKAKWLVEHGNKVSSLYVYEKKRLKDGSLGKKENIKRTASGAPFTHSIEHLSKKLHELKLIPLEVKTNLEFLQEFRNASVHFYLHSLESAQRLQELSMASVKNYTALVQDWFGSALSDFDFFLMPLALLNPPVEYQHDKSVEEERFLAFLMKNGFSRGDPSGRFSVAINVDVKFTRTKDPNALAVRLSGEGEATKVSLSDDQLLQRYKLSYRELTNICKARYSDFIENKAYHDLRKQLAKDQRYGYVRLLDPKNPKSSKKEVYAEAILGELDKHYKRK